VWPVPLLEVDQVVVRFGGVRALDVVDLAVDAGSITGLIGPNGAGKTTLFNAVCGLQVTEGGHIRLGDDLLDGIAPHRRARLGISRTFQRLEVFGSMSARDNIRVAAEVRRAWSRANRGPDVGAPEVRAAEIIEQVGLVDVADERVDALPTGLARLVEVGRALATEPRVLLLDEPSLGLAPIVVGQIRDLIVHVNEQGTSVLLVEQNATMALSIADEGYVLEHGRIVRDGPGQELLADKDIREFYLGIGEAGRRSFRDVKTYRRKKSWGS